MLRLSVIGVVLVTGTSLAGAADKCADAKDQATMNLCADTAYKEADRALNAQYAATRKAIVAYDAEGDKLLITAQRAWVTFRDAHCAATSFAFKGGSMEPMVRASCLAATTEARTAQLKSMLDNYAH
jgi:uncharacterized protein YecT (DUF1311 family)